MDHSNHYTDRTDSIIALFNDAFTASEGAGEGDLVASLVSTMFASVPPDDIRVFLALDEGALAGAIIFTRMTFADDDRTVFLLSPVAIAPGHQGKGVGQALLAHGLNSLRETGVDVALTYGDINFYAKVGFAQITEDVARAPQPLSYPEGWLGQSLASETLVPLRGALTCVAALDDPAYW